jgi:hypothetical protein
MDPVMKNRFVLLVLLLFTTLPSVADSISFTTVAYEDHPFRVVPMVGNPLLIPQSGFGQQDLIFSTELGGHVGVFVFSATLSLPGVQSTQGPVAFVCDADSCSVGFGWAVPLNYKVVAGILSVTIGGVTENYDFLYQSTAPEPGTILLLGTGLAGIVWRKGRTARGEWKGKRRLGSRIEGEERRITVHQLPDGFTTHPDSNNSYKSALSSRAPR